MIIKCLKCGKSFVADHRNRKYCSVACYNSAIKGVRPNIDYANRIMPKRQKYITSECKICGKIFSHLITKIRRYCSRECWSRRNPPILYYCLYCGKEYWARKSNNKIYCSHKCYALHQRIIRIGQGSPRWKGGKTKYAKILRCRRIYIEWRTAVFIRDDYTCRKCGIKSGIGRKIYLHAHHIKSVSQYPELIYEIDNGITLCKNCHLGEHHHKF